MSTYVFIFSVAAFVIVLVFGLVACFSISVKNHFTSSDGELDLKHARWQEKKKAKYLSKFRKSK